MPDLKIKESEMKRNWKQKNEIKIRKNISVLMDELNAFEQRMDERLTDEMGKSVPLSSR